MNKAALPLLLFFCVAAGLSGQEMSAEDIIGRVNDSLNPRTSFGKMKMTIVTSSGSKRTFISETWSRNKGEKTLVRYLDPKRIKGQAVLMLNHADDIWMYFPRTQRVRKMATHAKKQKMQGSDFSYEDMGGGDSFIKDFTSHRQEDEKIEGYDCFKLELVRRPDSDVSYSRLVLWIIKDNFVPVVIDYYNDNDPELNDKRMVATEITVKDGIPTATKVVMINRIDNTRTEMEILEVKYNLDLDDSMFSERELKK